jgi:predicted acylesterase/phospholipase RssA
VHGAGPPTRDDVHPGPLMLSDDVLAVAHALRRHPVFQRVSLRQLTDLVKMSWRHVIRIPLGKTEPVRGVFLLLLEGRAFVEGSRPMLPGDLVYTGTDELLPPAVLERIRADLRPRAALAEVLKDHTVSVIGRAAEGALLLPFTFEIVQAALVASASFCSSVQPEPLAELVAALRPSWELIWMCCDRTLRAPLEALTRILAASVATELHDDVGIIVGDRRGLRYSIWVDERFTPLQAMGTDVRAVFGDLQYRLFVVCPDTPDVPPQALHPAHAFDRIVYVTRTPPERIPPDLRRYVHPKALDPGNPHESYFSSFIPSILLGPPLPAPRPGLPPLRSLLGAIARDALSYLPEPAPTLLGLNLPDGFESEVLDEPRPTKYGGRRKSRTVLDRDSCRLRLDPEALARSWRDAVETKTVDTYHRTVLADASHARTAARWARAVSNKRVGLAVSGGGATSYRLIPLLKMLGEAGVPVDVFGGLSGGASLGAYYCRDGEAGLDGYVGKAGKLQASVGAFFSWLSSQLIETGMDYMFSGTTLDDLEVRLVAVATAHPEDGPPQPHAVVHGTLGQAVRVSGSFPVAFARTVKHGILYSDGASTTPLPARALPNYGADFVIACNTVPGPDNRNPLRDWPGADFWYRYTIVGQMIDAWVAQAFSLHRMSIESALDADVTIEPTPNRLSLAEMFLWLFPKVLIAQSSTDKRMLAGIEAVKEFWNRRKVT